MVLGLYYILLYGTDVRSFAVFRDTLVSAVGCTVANRH